MMQPLLRSPTALIGLSVITAVMLGTGFFPLVAGPGYESALLAGLLVPSVAALVTALQASRVRAEPFDAFCRGVANGAMFVLAAWLVTLVHGLRAGFCDLTGGSLHFALGPGIGALLGGAWGAVVGEIAGTRKRPVFRVLLCLLLSVGGPLSGIAISTVRFYVSPMIFAYDPFAGYFSGTFYDTAIDVSGLVTYRAGSLASLFAAFTVALHLGRDERGRLTYQGIGRPGILVAGAVALAASLAVTFMGHRLRHWQTPRTIADELGAPLSGERCDIVYPRAMPRAEAQRFARECDAHVRLGEQWLGLDPSPQAGKITVYLFTDAAQKRELMGAADTYIAKPWRREVYVQAAGFPHPVLGHEIIHVLAGRFGRGPMRVAGSAGGLLPNPGLIEGLAVAASSSDGDLTTQEWAKAMKDLGLLPPLSKLFALGFLGENSSTAYTASGAFVEHIKHTYGVKAVREWYGGADLPAITSASWPELEGAWHAALDTVTLPDAAMAQARARFDRPAIFGRRCPHVVDACRQRAETLHGHGDHEGAIAEYRAALALDPENTALRIAAAKAQIAGGGDVQQALQELEQIAADERLQRFARDRALEELGDWALVQGQTDAAVNRYREIMNRLVDEDRLRTLDVKIAAANNPDARAAIVALLLGAKGRGPDKVHAAELLGTWSATAPQQGLPPYLLARHYLNAGDFDQAADRLDRARGRALDIPRVKLEAERLRLVIACGIGDTKTAIESHAAYTASPLLPTARRAAATSLLERCTGGVK